MNPWLILILFAGIAAATKPDSETTPVATVPKQIENYGYPSDIQQTKPPCNWENIGKAASVLSVAGAAIGGNLSAEYGTVIGGVAGAIGGAAGAYYVDDC